MTYQRPRRKERHTGADVRAHVRASQGSTIDASAPEPPAVLPLDDRTKHLLGLLAQRESQNVRVIEQQRLFAHLLRTVSRPPDDEPGVWHPQTIRAYLLSCQAACEAEARTIARPLPPSLWLWCLRYYKALAGFDKSLPTENGSSTDMAVVLSALEAERVTPRDSVADATAITNSDVDRMLRFWEIARTLCRVGGLLGLTALNVSFSFRDHDPWPQPDIPAATQEALDLFFARWRGNPYPLCHFGTLVAEAAPNRADYNESVIMVGHMHLDERQTWVLPWTYGPDALYTMADGRARAAPVAFMTVRVSLRGLAEVASDARLAEAPWSDDVGAMLLLLRLVVTCKISEPWIDDALSCGYLVVDEQDFSTRVDAQINAEATLIRAILPGVDVPSSAAELFAISSAGNASIRPPAVGPVVRRAGTALYLDLYGASRRLEQRLFVPAKDGDMVNAPATHFELAVQGIIDRSPWAPPKHLRDLRGKQLTINGRDITDIDAIGVRGDTLLLVDCKGIRITEEFQSGDYDAIRNARTAVEGKPNPTQKKDKGFVATWQEHCDDLSANPHGDNYDFRPWPKIVPVVCLLQAVYLSIGPAIREVAPGLRAAAVAYELEDWLTNP